MILLGLDLSLSSTGYSIIDENENVLYTGLTTNENGEIEINNFFEKCKQNKKYRSR